MEYKESNVVIFGDNINTDIISPPQYMELDIEESSKYAISAIDPQFYEKVKTRKIMVAGDNFGSGSSRETSPLSLKYLGVEAIVAKSFARIFYRNSLNVGLLVIECKDAERINDNDKIQINYKSGVIKNLTNGESLSCSKIPDHLTEMMEEGGLVSQLKKIFSNG